MNAHDDVRQKVLQWITFADEDLIGAKQILSLERRAPYRLVAWHAQQCAEKYIKAYLVFHQVDFPHTHRILYLLELCPEKETWGNTLKNAETLTPFAVMTRYPGEDEPVSEAEAKKAVITAELVRKTIRTALEKRGIKPDVES